MTDVHASGKTTVFGTVAGTLADVASSDNAHESITEVLSTGGNPSSRYSHLEHRWTFVVPAGSRVELHVEAHAPFTSESFRFESSTNGSSFDTVALPPLSTTVDPNEDLVAVLPSSVSGAVTIRVVDGDQTPGEQFLDAVSIDEIWIRVVP